MRKICFSGCFKRKMSKARENTWQFILAMLGIILVMLIGATVVGLTGWGLSLIWETIEPKDFIPMGFLFYIVLAIVGWMLWLAYQFYKWFTKKTFKLVKEKYENGGSLEECAIFEYCDDPQTSNNNK